MEPILTLPPSLPAHDPAPLHAVPHRIVAEWPAGTFVENLCVLASGDVIVSILTEARLDRVTLSGAISCFRQFDAPPTGLVVADGYVHVAVGEPGAGTPVLWRLDPATGEGGPWIALDGMVFANGVAGLGESALLVADSWLGTLFRVDLRERRIAPWFHHEALTRAPGFDFLPGANGVKRWRDEIAVSSTGRAELYRIAVRPDGSAGDLSTLATRLRVDDLAYDAEGRLYLTTHIGHSLVRLDRAGNRETLAGVAEGMAGSTACAFGPDGGLCVTTTGGIVLPPGGVLQPAKLVLLDLDHGGA